MNNIIHINDLCLQLIYSLNDFNWTAYNILLRLNKEYNYIFKNFEEIFINNILKFKDIFSLKIKNSGAQVSTSKYQYIFPNNIKHGIQYKISSCSYQDEVNFITTSKYEKGRELWKTVILKNKKVTYGFRNYEFLNNLMLISYYGTNKLLLTQKRYYVMINDKYILTKQISYSEDGKISDKEIFDDNTKYVYHYDYQGVNVKETKIVRECRTFMIGKY